MARLTKDEVISYFKNKIKQYKVLLGGVIGEGYRSHIEKIVLCYEAAITSLEKGEDLMDRIRGFEVVIDEKRKTVGDITLPTRGSSTAMAYDFYATEDFVVFPNSIAKVWTDVKAYMQENECLILNVRSSMGGKFMLANTSGWIDSDYYSNENNDGNIGIFLKNISDETQRIKKGDRIAQGAFFNFLVADNGNTDNIRTGGFGSTN